MNMTRDRTYTYEIGDFTIQCPVCGIQIWHNSPHECISRHPVPYIPPLNTRWYNLKEHCEHCYCQKETVLNVPHKKCCMCGHRKAVDALK